MKIHLKYIFQTLKIILITFGCISIVLCVLAFTPVPYWTRYWLGTSCCINQIDPDYIILLGGSGMPSGENLVRLYYTATLAKKNDSSAIIIVHPFDSTVYFKMKNELIKKNIDSLRISFEIHGTNTRSQALCVAKYFPKTLNSRIVILTSPENMLRSVLAFRKVGFKYLDACPAFEEDMDIDLSFDGEKLGGRKYIPNVGKNINIRYNFWSYLKIEIGCLRELFALTYYKIKGWI